MNTPPTNDLETLIDAFFENLDVTESKLNTAAVFSISPVTPPNINIFFLSIAIAANLHTGKGSLG
jgi:hypothetical protein